MGTLPVKRKILVALCTCVVLLVLLYINSYSITIRLSGFKPADVYQQTHLTSNSAASYYTLVADEEHYGLLNLHQDKFGIWHKDDDSIIISKNQTVKNQASLDFVHTLLPMSMYNIGSFSVGILDKDEAEKVCSLHQQDGTFTVDLYQIAENCYLAMFHVTADSSEKLNKTNDYIWNTVHFSGL